MPSFEELWLNAKRYRIEAFKPFGLVEGQLWAPAYIKDRWRILELDMDVASNGATQVFCLAGDTKNLVSFVHAVAARRDRAREDRKAVG